MQALKNDQLFISNLTTRSSPSRILVWAESGFWSSSSHYSRLPIGPCLRRRRDTVSERNSPARQTQRVSPLLLCGPTSCKQLEWANMDNEEEIPLKTWDYLTSNPHTVRVKNYLTLHFYGKPNVVIPFVSTTTSP